IGLELQAQAVPSGRDASSPAGAPRSPDLPARLSRATGTVLETDRTRTLHEGATPISTGVTAAQDSAEASTQCRTRGAATQLKVSRCAELDADSPERLRWDQ